MPICSPGRIIRDSTELLNLYYTYFLANIYWHFVQKADKIPKTHTFWGLKSVSDISSAYLLHSFKPLFSGIFKAFVYYLFITGNISYAPLLLYYTSESRILHHFPQSSLVDLHMFRCCRHEQSVDGLKHRETIKHKESLSDVRLPL